MNEIEKKAYKKKNTYLRFAQMIYGSKVFSLPQIYKLRNKWYTKGFCAGKNLRIGYDVFINRTHELNGKIFIGDQVSLCNHVHIDFSGEVVIGDNVRVAEYCKIYSHKHKIMRIMDDGSGLRVIPVKTVIEKNVQIESSSIIMPGVSIGENSVIIAGSVVIDDVEPNSIVMGNPARDVRDIMVEMNRRKKKK